MKVLLVYASTWKVLASVPVGLAMVARNAKEAGHEVWTLDLLFENDPDTLLEEALRELAPDIVGFSMRILDNQSMLKLHNPQPDYERWVALANRHAPTVIGGAVVTIAPLQAFRRFRPTYAVAGQAERTFGDFLREVEQRPDGGGFETPGVIWREGEAIRRNPPLVDGFGACGSIDWSMVDFDKYRNRSLAPATVITKSGCDHRCIWCAVPTCFGPRFVPRDPEAIVDDLKRDARDLRLNRYPYWFVDGVFNEPEEWSRSLLEKIIISDVRVAFSVLAEPTESLDLEYARLLRRAGCTLICPMIGTGSEQLLERHRRPFTLDVAMRSMTNLERAGVAYIPSLLFGGPGETEQTVEETYRTYATLKPLLLSVGCGVRIVPNAEIERIARDEGVIDEATDLLDPTFYVSPLLDRQWLIDHTERQRRWQWSSLPQWARMFVSNVKPRFENARPRYMYS